MALSPTRLQLAVVAAVLVAATARAQSPEPLSLQSLAVAGARTTVTESPGVLNILLRNTDDKPRLARVAVFYPEQEDSQYARDVWVPGRATVTTWLPIGPSPPQTGQKSREIRHVLIDRTDGTERIILPPGNAEKVSTRGVVYAKRDLSTALLFDPQEGDLSPAAAGALNFSDQSRAAIGIPERASLIREATLAPTPEAFDGADIIVLAGNRLDPDPVGRVALRRWLEAGGTLWVMLDLVEPSSFAPILGDDFDIGVIDRVGLNTVNMKTMHSPAEVTWEVEKPVELVRVAPSPADRVSHTANGWPAAFSRRVGRGKVVFTALGAGGWFRPRPAEETRPGRSPPPFIHHPYLNELSSVLYQAPEADPFPPDVFRQLLADEIGYEIVSRRTVALVLGGFVLALLAAGSALRRSRRPEMLGWLTPAAALVGAGILVGLGERSRRVVPQTVAVAGIITPVAGSEEATVTGLYATFSPSSGPAMVGSTDGATVDLDSAGLDGQLRRRVQHDTGSWSWDKLALPAGVRTGPFRSVVKAGRVEAVARFEADGVRGTVSGGALGELADGIVLTPAREPAVIRLGSTGAFSVTAADALPPGTFITGTVLTDRQQRRQAVYQKLLSGNLPRHLEGRDLVLAWAELPAVPFLHPEGAGVHGTGLVAMPITFERTPPGSRVTVPAAFLPYRQVIGGRDVAPARTATFNMEMTLRFQLPAAVRPLTVERLTITGRVHTPNRRFTIGGDDAKKTPPVFDATAPADAIRVELTGDKLPPQDARGGYTFRVKVGEALSGASDTEWKIESLGLEVVGTTDETR